MVRNVQICFYVTRCVEYFWSRVITTYINEQLWIHSHLFVGWCIATVTAMRNNTHFWCMAQIYWNINYGLKKQEVKSLAKAIYLMPEL